MKEQIEEMARIISAPCRACQTCDGCNFEGTSTDEIECFDLFSASEVYNAGYRKQEWISVEERLPEKGQHVLCLYPQKDYGSKCVVDYAETADGFFAEQYLFERPSHWMPLPEPPKMKGGAE